jgi:hypothetical protein
MGKVTMTVSFGVNFAPLKNENAPGQYRLCFMIAGLGRPVVPLVYIYNKTSEKIEKWINDRQSIGI